MIHYHGTPISGPRVDAATFLTGRHGLVPFPRQDDLGPVSEFCQSFVFDNGAFSAWKRGEALDVDGYLEWVHAWRGHPGLDWVLIPDVIDGDEQANDELLSIFVQAGLYSIGVPVWHLHESLSRLETLCLFWPRVALGSSGDYSHPGAATWWRRMSEAMSVACDSDGRPKAKLHGLRMMNPSIFEFLPLSSADSTNAAVNTNSHARFGQYKPATAAQRAAVIADRIEKCNSTPVWRGPPRS